MTKTSALSGVINASSLAEIERKKREEEEAKKASALSQKPDDSATTFQAVPGAFEQMYGAPQKPEKFDLKEAERKAKTDVYGEAPVEATPTVKQYLDLGKQYDELHRSMDEITKSQEEDAKKVRSGEGTTLMGVNKPPPEFYDARRTEVSTQLYNAEKTMRDLVANMTPEDHQSYTQLQQYAEKIGAANKKEKELYDKAVAEHPVKAQVVEGLFGLVGGFAKTMAFGSLEPALKKREDIKEGYTPLQREIVDQARSQGMKFNTIAGKATSTIGSIAGFGTDIAMLSGLPLIAPASKSVQVGSATIRETAPWFLRATRGAQLFGGREAIAEGVKGEFNPKTIAKEALMGAGFEVLLPVVGGVVRRSTREVVSDSRFVFEPSAINPQLGAPQGGIKSAAVQFARKLSGGVSRSLQIYTKDGMYHELRVTPEAGKYVVEITNYSPSWFRQIGEKLMGSFKNTDDVIDVKPVTIVDSPNEAPTTRPDKVQLTRIGTLDPKIPPALESAAMPVPRSQLPLGAFIDATKAENMVRDYFTPEEVGVEFVNRILTPDGDRALGRYREGMISFIQNPNEITPDHEAVHAYLDLFTPSEQKAAILEEIKQQHNTQDDIHAEEILADGFVEYVKNGKVRGFSRQVIEWFRDMYAKIKGFFAEPDKARQLYRDMILQRRNLANEPNTTVSPDVFTLQNAMYQKPEALTTKLLKGLTKDTVGQQEIRDLLRKPDIKQAEREIITKVLNDSFADGKAISVKELTDAVRDELVPLKVTDRTANDTQNLSLYENIVLPPELQGNVETYGERVYQSPIPTKAGDVHFYSGNTPGGQSFPNYFAHTRIETVPMSDVNGEEGIARRVLEVQSDLFQKDRIENEYPNPDAADVYISKAERDDTVGRIQELKQLEPYKNTWWQRIIREEIRSAALDGQKAIMFPTGETAMNVEGLVNREDRWVTLDNTPVTGEDLNEGDIITYQTHDGVAHEDRRFLVIKNTGNGTFDAVDSLTAENDFGFHELIKKKNLLDDGRMPTLEELQPHMDEEIMAYLSKISEHLSASNTVDTENPIFKFYDNTMAGYLQKYRKGNIELITDPQGVTWWMSRIQPEDGGAVEAYQRDVLQGDVFGQELPEKQQAQEQQITEQQGVVQRIAESIPATKVTAPAPKPALFQQFPDSPDFNEIRDALKETTTELEQQVTSAENFIAERKAVVESGIPEVTQKLEGLAKNVRELIPPQQRRLPGGITRNEFFDQLAGSVDSVSALNDYLLSVADLTKNTKFGRDIREWVNTTLGGGTFDDIEDWSPFQNAITEKKQRPVSEAKGDLLDRAEAVINELGDIEIGEGKTLGGLLDEITMLELELNDATARSARGKTQKRLPAGAGQNPLPIGSDVAEVQAAAPTSQGETQVSGRALIEAITKVSKAKKREYSAKLVEAVGEARRAQKAKDMNMFAMKKAQIEGIKREMIDEIRKRVPPDQRGRFLSAVKNVSTRRQLEKTLERADKVATDVERRDAIYRLKDISRTNLKELRPEYREPIEQLINSVDPVKHTSKTLESALKLADFLEKEPENQIPESRLKDLAILAKKPIQDLTTEEINDLSDSIAHLVHLNTLKNKLLIKGKMREFAEVKKEAISNIETNHEQTNGAITGLDSMQIEKEPGVVGKIFTVDSYNAELKTEILDGKEDGAIKQTIYDGIDSGVTEELRLQQTAEDFFKAKLDGIDMSRWSYAFQPKAKNVDKVTVQISGGRSITMSKGERVAFLLHNMNANNRRHLLEGGFSFPNTPSKILSLSAEDLSAIEASATEEEFTVAGAISEYLNTIQKQAINNVSVRLNGHEVAREKDYFPIRTSYLDRFHDDLIKGKNYSAKTLEGMGIFKERQKASNALIVEDAFSTLYKSIKQTSAYVGLAEPLRSAKMLLHDNDFQIAARTAGKNHYVTSLKQYLERIEGDSVNTENVDKITYDLINKLDVAVLGLNPFVMLKQPISLINAGTEIDYKYLVPASASIPTTEDIAEMKLHSPQLRDRLDGNVTREAGEIAEVGAAKKFFTGENLWSQKFTSGLQRFDQLAITRIWNAAKKEISDTKPDLAGESYWNAVRDRAEMIVRRTQSTSHVKDRSTIGMTKNPLVRMLTRFSSERNKSYQIIRRAGERYNRSEKTTADKAKLLNTLFLVTVVSPLIAIGIDATRDAIYKKDKKRTMFSTALDVVSNDLGMVYFLGSGFDSLRSKIENGTFAGYDVDTSATQFMNQVIDTLAEGGTSIMQAVTQEKYKSGANKGQKKWAITAQKFMVDAIKTTAQIKGVPTAPLTMGQAALKWLKPEKSAKKKSAL